MVSFNELEIFLGFFVFLLVLPDHNTGKNQKNDHPRRLTVMNNARKKKGRDKRKKRGHKPAADYC